MPDTWWNPAVGQQPPDPPLELNPAPLLPTLVVDPWGVFLVDGAQGFLGFDTNWGTGGPLARLLQAERSLTRAF